MLSSDGITLMASLVVGLATVLAAYFTMTFGKISTRAEQDIANAFKHPVGEKLEMVPDESEEGIPLGVNSVGYEMFLRRVASDLGKDTAFGNEDAGALMRSYHEQALAQARAQFWLGVGAATVGFLWILLSGLYVSNLSGMSKVVPGVIIEATATLFLKQSSEIRQRATDFYDRLQSYGKQRASLTLVTSMRDSRLQSVAQILLALHMAGAPTADVTTILGQEISARTHLVGKDPERQSYERSEE
jgi:hypothetical protein